MTSPHHRFTSAFDRRHFLRYTGIAGLGQKIKEMEHNEGKMDPQELEATVSRWADIVRTGKDPLNRPPGTMLGDST